MSLELARLGATGSRPTLRVVVVTTAQERAACARLRADIYVNEMGILSSDHPYVGPDGLVDPYDRYSTNLLLMAGDVAVGTARVTQACDGPLEIEQYVDLAAVGRPRGELVEVTRFMLRKAWRRSAAGPLLGLALYRLMRRSQAHVLVVAGKLSNLGRYYKNTGLRSVPGVPPFRYGLTGCDYELLTTDFGGPWSLARVAWDVRVAVLSRMALLLGDVGRRVLRRGFQTAPQS
jgi:hypothetical protein